MRKLIISSIILLFAISFSRASYSVGDTVSNFTLTDCNGNQVSLYDYYWAENGGQQYVVLINFSEPW